MHRTRIATIVAVAAVAATGCGDGTRTAAVRVSGHVEATEVRVSTQVAGRVVELDVDEGDPVEAGQVLARIDTVDLALALRAAEAERAAADADVRLRRAGYRDEDIAEAEAQRAALLADLAQAERELARMQGLLDAGSGTEKSRDDALARRDALSARARAAAETVRKLRAGFRREEIDAARARLDAAEAGIARLNQDIADATVTSPAAGVVTDKIAEAGEWLPLGSLILVVTDLDHAWLTVYVPEPDLPGVVLGQSVRVETDDGGVHAGRVTFIASEAEFTPKNVQTRDERVKLVFRVKIGLDNRDGTFKPGMPAVAEFPRREASS